MLNFYEAIKESTSFLKIEVNPLLFVEYTCMAEETKFGIWSDNNYFAFITSGKKIWKTVRHTYEVNEGDILFVKKGANLVHQFLDDAFCAIFVFIPDEFIQGFVRRYNSMLPSREKFNDDQDAVVRVHPDELLKGYYHSIQSYLSLSYKPQEQLIVHKFEELLLSLFSSFHHGPLTDYFLSLCQSQEYQMSRVMDDNFAFNLKLENYAQLCNMSLSTFKRVFKRHYHTTPASWLKDKRLDLAYHRLISTDLSISQISFECGFEETSHFIRVFKERFRQTPLHCRQQHTSVSARDI